MTASCSNAYCDNSSLRNSELCVACFKDPDRFSPDLIMAGAISGGSLSLLNTSGPNDIRLLAPNGGSVFIQGTSFEDLEERCDAQAELIRKMQSEMAAMSGKFEQAIAIGQETKRQLEINEELRESEREREFSLAGMYPRIFGRRKKNGK